MVEFSFSTTSRTTFLLFTSLLLILFGDSDFDLDIKFQFLLVLSSPGLSFVDPVLKLQLKLATLFKVHPVINCVEVCLFPLSGHLEKTKSENKSYQIQELARFVCLSVQV